MKKRDERRFQAMVRELFYRWNQHALDRGSDPRRLTLDWKEVHPEWKRFFYRWAREKLQEAGKCAIVAGKEEAAQ